MPLPAREHAVQSIIVDPTMGNTYVRFLRDRVAHADWPPVRDFLLALPDPDDFDFYLNEAADVGGIHEWIPRVIEAEPGSVLPTLLRGVHAVNWAWEARGPARESDVTEKQLRVFFSRLRLAEECLHEVIARDPMSTTARATLITTSIAGRLGVDETRRRFDAVVAVHPLHRTAHARMLDQLCAKWGGSHKAMHTFAREAMHKAPPGHGLAGLISSAHIEHWLALSEEDGIAYMRSPAVRAELHAAADLSIRHPAYLPPPTWPGTFNDFAMAFWLAGDLRAAAQVFAAIGDLVTEYPWAYHGVDAGTMFLRARAESFAAAAR
jgi:hypothetical protein